MADLYAERLALNPWEPMANPIDVKHLGKLSEEVNELGTAIARCLIQGMDECEPTTGKPNRQWLTEEVADVLCNIELNIERFDLNRGDIERRISRKREHIRAWHAFTPGER